MEKLESVQHKAARATTSAIQGTSKEKKIMELSLESLKSRRWFRRLCCIFRIMKNQGQEYLDNLIPKVSKTLAKTITFHSSVRK